MMKEKRQLTEQQQKFLDVLFKEAGGDPLRAKKLAGYADAVSTPNVLRSLKEEVLDLTQLYLALNAPKAAFAIISGIDDPTELGIKEKLNAAKDLLDRVGVVKTEKVQVEAGPGLMILPPKKVDEN
jgi:hypothetical protein